MPNIRINSLPPEVSPSASDVVPIDGATTRKATLTAIVDAGRPLANQAEAEAGTDPSKAMTPLTTAQAIAAQGATQFASAAQGATADSALQPAAIGVTVQPFGATLTSMEGLPLAAGDIIYATGPDTVDRLPAGVDGQFISQAGGVPTWATATGLGDLLATNNLSDLDSADTALDNLGFGAAGKAIAADGTTADVRDYIGSSVGFATRTAAAAWSPEAGPDYIRTNGYAAAGDGGGALYKKVVAEPSHAGKFSITLTGGGGTVWYEIAERVIRPQMFGAVGDGVADDTSAMQAALDVSTPLDLTKGSVFAVSSTLTVTTVRKLVRFNDATVRALAGFTDLRLIDIQANSVELRGPGTVDGASLPPLTTSFIGVTWEGFGIACRGTSGAEYTGLYIGDKLNVRNCPGAAIGLEYVDDWEINGVAAFDCDEGTAFDGPGVYYINQVDRYTARNVSARGFNWKGWNNSNGFDFTTSQMRFKDGKNDQAAVFFKGCTNFVASDAQIENAFGIKCDKSDYFVIHGVMVDCNNYGLIGLMVQAGSNFTTSDITVKDYVAAGIQHIGHPSTPATAVEKAIYTDFVVVLTGAAPVSSVGFEIFSYSTAVAKDVIIANGYIQNCYNGVAMNQGASIATDNVVLDNIVIDTFSSSAVNGSAKNMTWRDIKFRNAAASQSCIRLFSGDSDPAEKWVIEGCEGDNLAATVTFINGATTGSTEILVDMLMIANNSMKGGSRFANIALNNATDYVRTLNMTGNQSWGAASLSCVNLSNGAGAVNTQVCIVGNTFLSDVAAKQNINFVDTAASANWNGVVENNMAGVVNKPNNV